MDSVTHYMTCPPVLVMHACSGRFLIERVRRTSIIYPYVLPNHQFSTVQDSTGRIAYRRTCLPNYYVYGWHHSTRHGSANLFFIIIIGCSYSSPNKFRVPAHVPTRTLSWLYVKLTWACLSWSWSLSLSCETDLVACPCVEYLVPSS